MIICVVRFIFIVIPILLDYNLMTILFSSRNIIFISANKAWPNMGSFPSYIYCAVLVT